MRAILLYLAVVGLPVLALLGIVGAGERIALPAGAPAGGPAAVAAAAGPLHLATLVVQVAVVLAVARGVGWLFRRVRQPQVVGEMAAGILLGPSVLGWWAPGFSAALFPAGSLGYLDTLSQVGLLLFMFLVGLEFDPGLLRGRGRAAVVTSHASIVVPFVLGAALALYLYPRLSDGGVGFTGFALFMGAAMSVTAFPVLARILTERDLLGTRVGALTIACAAVDDVTAWTILAVVVAIVRRSAMETPLWLTLAGTAAFVVTMAWGVRRALGWLEAYYRRRGRLTQDVFAGVMLLLLASALTTEWLGIHALFGAFALGAVMPKEPGFVHDLTEKLEDVTVVFLLPLFFAVTGLRTSVGLLGSGAMWGYAGLVLLVAVAGKFGGSTLAARATGLPWREAGALGILMNTRGLMELVILTIGLELGVISPALFTMMVLMALATTAATTPVLEWIYPSRLLRASSLGAEEAGDAYGVLLPVSLPGSGPGLLRAALAMAPEGRRVRVYALHLRQTADRSLGRSGGGGPPGREEVLAPLLAVAAAEGVEVVPLSFSSVDVAADIVDIAHARRVGLVLLGWHKPVLGRSILSGTVSAVLRAAPADIAVLVDRGERPWLRVLVPFRTEEEDGAALETARNLARRGGAEVTVLHVTPVHAEPPAVPPGVRLRVVEGREPLEAAVEEARAGYDLLVVGVSRAWGTTPTPFGHRHEELARASDASLLVVQGRPRASAPAAAPAAPRLRGADATA